LIPSARITAEGNHEHQQASQQRSQRQRLIAFEQKPPDGKRIATIKILRLYPFFYSFRNNPHSPHTAFFNSFNPMFLKQPDRLWIRDLLLLKNSMSQ
jgi:hypothetical protein